MTPTPKHCHADAGVEFILPLNEHRRRAGHNDIPDPAAEQKFGCDEASLDGFAEADVVRDEEVNAGKLERLPEGLQLVGIDANAGAERGLEESLGAVAVIQCQRSVLK